jgi:hypothetical protein
MSGWERPDEFQFKTDSEGHLVADLKKSGPRRPGGLLGKKHA